MNIALAREFFLWCTVINYGVLIVWWAIIRCAHDDLYHLVKRLFGRSFVISVVRMDEIQFTVMTLYKIGVFLFNLVPFVALCIIR